MLLDKQLYAFSTIIICVSSSHILELDQEWNAWKSKYDKTYVTLNDELFRRNICEKTWDEVQKHNHLANQGLTSYMMGMNHFADLVGVIESHYCIKENELPVLSEQQLVDCDKVNEGCCGGLPVLAFHYVAHNGVMLAKDYTYSEKKSKCLYKSNAALMINVSNYYMLLGEDNMASSVALDGPIKVGIDASVDFKKYSNGTFSGQCDSKPNHAVIIVGYGTEYDKKKNVTTDYWIIRNRMHLDKQLWILSAILICVSASHLLDQEWDTWKTKNVKKYVTVHDELFRRKAWEETWNKVQKHNQLFDQGVAKYTMAMNQFADMTPEERSSKNCLYTKNRSPIKKNIPEQVHAKKQNLPDSVDWRDSKCVTKIKNQGLCGSCWAFATVGVVESHLCIKTKELFELSEQQLVDCDSGDGGCCGGLPTNALGYVARHGVMLAKDYEYSAKQFTCLYKPDDAIMFNVSKYYSLPGEDNMASSVALDGPIVVGIDASNDFQLYCKGIFTGECSKYPTHAVIIVGYGTEHDEKEDEDIDYWIIKNSWGKEWGDHGYAKMRRNVNLCGITSMAASLDLVH